MAQASRARDDSYARSVATLHALLADLPASPPVTLGRMFNGDGAKVRNSFFAFIGRNGDLVAKLPEERVLELVRNHTGQAVTMGKRTMREWTRVPVEVGADTWAEILGEAHRFVLGG